MSEYTALLQDVRDLQAKLAAVEAERDEALAAYAAQFKRTEATEDRRMTAEDRRMTAEARLAAVESERDAIEARWSTGECCSDCPHHGFTAEEHDEMTWPEINAVLHQRAEAAEARLAEVKAALKLEYHDDACASMQSWVVYSCTCWKGRVTAAVRGEGDRG